MSLRGSVRSVAPSCVLRRKLALKLDWRIAQRSRAEGAGRLIKQYYRIREETVCATAGAALPLHQCLSIRDDEYFPSLNNPPKLYLSHFLC